MNKHLAVLALAAVAGISAAPAVAGNVGISIRIGDPGFYGQLYIDNGYRPQLIQSRPVIVVNRYRNAAPIYLRVPPGHSRNWSKHCARYDACARPVYFVRDEWYRDVYSPRYRRDHSHDRHDRRHDRRDDRRDDRRSDRRDDRRDDHRDDRRDDRRDRDGDRDRDGRRSGRG